MSEPTISLIPPFVWPNSGGAFEQVVTNDPPYDQLLCTAGTVFGVIYDLDACGCGRLKKMCGDRTEPLCRLIVIVSPACATKQIDLESLVALEREYGDRIQFRIRALSVSDGLPGSAICVINDNYPEGVLIVGPSSNFGSDQGAPCAVNLVFRSEAVLRTEFCRWFDAGWIGSAPLTTDIAAIPPLFPAPGSAEAAELWQQYEEACTHALEEGGYGADEAVPDSVQGEVVDSERSPTTQLGVPLLDELGQKIAKVLASGSQVTIDKHTRIPPLDAPIKPEWFGVQSLRQIGAVTRRVEYHISALSDQISRSLENKKKGTRTLLDRLSFPLNDGVRWMPDRVFPMFEEEMNRLNGEGQKALKDATGEDAAAFVKSQRNRLYKDADDMYKDFHPDQSLPESLFEQIVTELKQRLEKAGSGLFLPKISRVRVQFRLEPGSQWESQWGAALTFLYAIAEFPRKSLSDPYYLRGLRVDVERLLSAMDVCGDAILSKKNERSASARAKEELALLKDIVSDQADDRAKCVAIMKLMMGANPEEIKADMERQSENESLGKTPNGQPSLPVHGNEQVG
jgi:hypothetical protein